MKTLEEPTDNTLLIMVAKPSHRLPATIASRCTRVQLRAPARPEALAWLEGRGQIRQNWNAALDEEMEGGLRAIAAGAADVTLVADHWVKSNLALRLSWLENWITRRVHTYLGAPGSNQSAERVRLPAALLKPKIRALFELLDAARELRRLAATGLNQQLALEALLLGGKAALAK